MTVSEYPCGTRYDFEEEGLACTVIVPEHPAPGNPWIWRAEFLGAFDTVDRAMVARGWHLAYCKLCDRYGCPSAVADMKRFRDLITKKFSLREKTILFGFSRGGLYSVNYALTYPGDVAGLYLDAPVLDLHSWPFGEGKSQRYESCAVEALACYGLTAESFADYHNSPIDRAEELAGHGIPVLLIAGEADRVVPFDENGEPFYIRFVRAGGLLRLILKPGCDHHPHSIEDPEPAVRFILHEMA